jgi:hypothetical protein
MRDENDKPMWGKVDKIGKGTKATYEPAKKTITFAFNRDPHTTSEQLRKLRETLMKELKDIGYISRMKYNGEVVVDNIQEEDVNLVKKNHQLIIHLTNKLVAENKEKDASNEPT